MDVPRDVSRIGFGGRLRDSDFRLRLTSVTVDEEEMGRRAAGLLDEMAHGQRAFDDDEHIHVALELSEGRTLGLAS